MLLETIYPYDAQNISLENGNLYCDESQIDIIEKIDERTFKISINGVLYGFVHDEKYCAYDLWQKNYLYYTQPVRFIRMPKYNSLFCDIAKNACTTVVSEIYNNCFKYFWEQKIKTNQLIWEKHKYHKRYHKIIYSIENYFNEKKSFNTKFFIYDDPLKRFIRALNDKYIGHRWIISNLTEPYDTKCQDYISKFILLTRLNLLNKDSWDQHIVPISILLDGLIPEFTDIVEIKDLEKFMVEKFKIKPKRYHVSDKRIITQDLLTQQHINDIKNIYKEDYEIPVKYADKFYK